MGTLRVKVPDTTVPGAFVWIDIPTIGPMGPPGAPGVPGPQGPGGIPGPPGPMEVSADPGNVAIISPNDGLIYVPAGAVTQGFVHTQGVAAAVWTIDHTLPFAPNVVVVDSTGRQVEGDVEYLSPTQVQVTFSGGFAGQAFLS